MTQPNNVTVRTTADKVAYTMSSVQVGAANTATVGAQIAASAQSLFEKASGKSPTEQQQLYSQANQITSTGLAMTKSALETENEATRIMNSLFQLGNKLLSAI
jgi:hypothetical protein